MAGMEDTLARFHEQFEWQPEVEHPEVLRPHKHYVVCGMGGSHLGAWLIKRVGGITNIAIHRDYGLPHCSPEVLADSLIVLSSFSGTTEEVLDAGREALARGIRIACIATGGKLIEFAREHALTHIKIPDGGLEPRMAIGYSMLAFARLMGNTALEASIRDAGLSVDAMAGRDEGARIAMLLEHKVPLIYSSNPNLPLSYIWKVKFNETAKIPAFIDAVPEMCHNELSGFDVVDSTRDISSRMHVILLEDRSDHPRIQKRMQVASQILGEKGISVAHVQMTGDGFRKAFSTALLADWVTLELARRYGVVNPETPLIADFKRRIDL